MSRKVWTEEEVACILRDIGHQLGHMPTFREIVRFTGSNAAACAANKRRPLDEWADLLGLARADHDSRRGWRWEDWMAEQAEARGLEVEKRATITSPWDLKIAGKRVDVKVATGSVINGGYQWTWRVNKAAHGCDVFALVATRDEHPPILLFRPSEGAPLSCMTARENAMTKRLGAYEQYRDNWQLLEA